MTEQNGLLLAGCADGRVYYYEKHQDDGWVFERKKLVFGKKEKTGRNVNNA